MQSHDQEVLAQAFNWAAAGHRFALVTVARTWGSSPRPAGAWMLLRHDGRVAGSVSGGCIEDDLIGRMQDGSLRGPKPFSLVFGVTSEDARRHGLPCGGTLEVVVEPDVDLASLAPIERCLRDRSSCVREVNLASGMATVSSGASADEVTWDGSILRTPHGPAWRMLIIGSNQLGRSLAGMAVALDYQVTVCDPRPEYAEVWDQAAIPLVRTMPDDTVVAMKPDARTVIVAVTHDPKLDDMALLEALRSDAFYVGALGSRRNNEQRRARLAQYFDFSADELSRLHGPVGLPLGSRTPAEIAIAIVAELIALRRGGTAVLPQTKESVA